MTLWKISMRRIAVRLVLATALVGLGWTAGKAQVQAPDFELLVDAPAGETLITCKRGCGLAWVERGIPGPGGTMLTFRYGCGGPGAGRCESGAIGGWVRP